MNAEQKGNVFQNLRKNYEQLEYPEDLQDPQVTNAYIMHIGNKKRTKVSRLDVAGVFPQNCIEKAKDANKLIRQSVQGLGMVNVNVFCRAQVGQDMGLIKFATKSTEAVNVAINHEGSEVILIEFWASWCKFSQVPIKATNDMMAANKSKWGDKVRAVGLSIDQDKAKCEAFI